MLHPNPPLVFHGTGPVFFGLEIEIETPDLAGLIDTPISWFKYESCCGARGGELVTHPMSWDYWLEKGVEIVGGMLDRHKKAGGIVTYNHGNHIHVSKAGWNSGVHLYRTLEFMGREPDLLFLLSGRPNKPAMDLWALLPRTGRAPIHDHMAPGQLVRGNALATASHFASTNEFRLFASSLDIDKICQNMECVKSLIDFAGTNLELNAGEYAAYVHKHRKTFPNLTGFLTTHGYIKAAKPSRKAVPACA